jgi:ABC-type antimicrobial peptide transport system permease subunit
MPGVKGPWYTVVGVVGNVRHYELSAPPTPQMYVTESQVIDSFVTLTVRTTGDPRGVASAVRSIVIREAPGVAPAAPATLSELVSKSIRTQRFAMLLLGLFSSVALTLAMVGVYGTVAYSVARRTREFGVRLALGARRADIGRLVLAEAARLLATGIVVGTLAAVALTRLLGTLLYGVTPSDPWTLAAIVLVVAAATFVAQLTPALRATWVDPSTALQAE